MQFLLKHIHISIQLRPDVAIEHTHHAATYFSVLDQEYDGNKVDSNVSFYGAHIFSLQKIISQRHHIYQSSRPSFLNGLLSRYGVADDN